MDKLFDKGDSGRMKFNLKNRPKVTEDDIDCYTPEGYKYEEWLVGFEKELRSDVTSKYISEWGGHVDALIWLIKEILGG